MYLSKRNGFTLIELLVVIAVIALLAAILIPSFAGVLKTAAKAEDRSRARSIGQALFSYSMDRGGKIPQAYWHQRATADDTGGGGTENGHLAWILRETLGGSNLQNKQMNPMFASSHWLKKIGATGDPQLWLDLNRSGCYRYNTHSWSTSSGCAKWFPFPTPSSSCGTRFGIDQIDAPSSTWLLTDSDSQIAPFNDVLDEPLHGNVRVTLYWDTSVHDVPVADYHQGGPDP